MYTTGVAYVMNGALLMEIKGIKIYFPVLIYWAIYSPLQLVTVTARNCLNMKLI